MSKQTSNKNLTNLLNQQIASNNKKLLKLQENEFQVQDCLKMQDEIEPSLNDLEKDSNKNEDTMKANNESINQMNNILKKLKAMNEEHKKSMLKQVQNVDQNEEEEEIDYEFIIELSYQRYQELLEVCDDAIKNKEYQNMRAQSYKDKYKKDAEIIKKKDLKLSQGITKIKQAIKSLNQLHKYMINCLSARDSQNKKRNLRNPIKKEQQNYIQDQNQKMWQQLISEWKKQIESYKQKVFQLQQKSIFLQEEFTLISEDLQLQNLKLVQVEKIEGQAAKVLNFLQFGFVILLLISVYKIFLPQLS